MAKTSKPPRKTGNGFARPGQREWARPPAKQRAATDVLKQADLVADRRRCHAEFVRRLLEARMPRGGFERTKRGQWRELSHGLARVNLIHLVA